MRKIISMIITLCLIMSILCSCKGKDTTGPLSTEVAELTESVGNSANSTNAENAENAENAADSDNPDNKISSDIKMGFIFLHNESSTYDLNFLKAAKTACRENGVEYELRTGIPEGDECYRTACELAESGCDIIFADSFGHESYLIEAAKKYPEVQFCHATGTRAHTENLSNYHNAFATIYEGRYLAGAAAGLKINEMIAEGKLSENQARIGYIGAFTYAEVISGYTAFYLGAKSICPSVTMEVTFTGSWYDEEEERKCAKKLISKGCVLISQHADSLGAPSACEEAGVPNISYNGSNLSACPDTFIVASFINWAPYFSHVIECVRDNVEIESDWVGNISTDSVKLTPVGHNATAGTAEKLEEIKAALQDGTIHVFDVNSFTVEGKKITSYLADVNTDPEYKADTQVINNSVFTESSYRSAPYFDLRIDGIHLLDEAY